MLRNYWIVTYRNLAKNGVYSFINIAGLSVGIACSILIMLWVNNEISWDNFHEKKGTLHRVYISGKGDNGIYTQMAIPLPLWPEFRDKEPGIKHVAPTNWGDTYLITYGERRLYKKGYYAGEDFLKMFSFPLVKGSPENQLNDPSSIVLTQSAAKSLFDNEEPVGKVVRVNDKLDLIVSGIVEDVPSNSTFQFECLLPFSTYMIDEPWVKESLNNWGNNSFNLYVEFQPGLDAETMEAKLEDVIKKNSSDNNMTVTFLPIERWRLYSDFKNGKSVSGMIEYVRMFTIVAIFVLVIACINFMNLATARSEKRAKEVGIRKSIGSGRKELIFQFMGETFLTTAVAFFIAIGIAEVGMPFYNTIVDKNLSIDYTNPLWYATGLGVVVITGFISGSYPALFLSSFKPAAVLKGRMQGGKSGAIPRKVMVTMQFFFSIVLIIGTSVIYFQLNHLKNRPTGYDQNNLLYVPNTGEIGKNFNLIKNELLHENLVSSVTGSSSPITAIYSFQGDIKWSGKREDQRPSFATVAVQHDYTRTMGIKMISGRDFSEDYADSASMILNEAAVQYMGLTEPIGETIRFWNTNFTIVGVMENVVMSSPSRPVDPTLLVFNRNWMSDITMKISEGTSAHAVLPRIEEIFRRHNPAYPFVYYFTDQEFARKFTSIQRIGNLSNLFSFLAILISCLGLFGLAAFTAEQRTKEIGIRKVLGATVSSVVVLISKDFTKLVFIAFCLAAPLGFWIMHNWLTQYDYRIEIEWWIFAFSGSAALVLAIVVVSYQALKAAVSNPVNSLKNE